MQQSTAWLSNTPWSAIIAINQALCENQKLDLLKSKKHDKAKAIWEKHHGEKTSLQVAIETCRRCNDLLPFTYHSGNTFAKIAHNMVEPWAALMVPVEAHVLRTTVAHYVNGQVSKAELNSVLKLAENSVNSSSVMKPSKPPVIISASIPDAKPQEQPA